MIFYGPAPCLCGFNFSIQHGFVVVVVATASFDSARVLTAVWGFHVHPMGRRSYQQGKFVTLQAPFKQFHLTGERIYGPLAKRVMKGSLRR